MPPLLDYALVALLVLGALAYLGRKIFAKPKGGCSSCAPPKRK